MTTPSTSTRTSRRNRRLAASVAVLAAAVGTLGAVSSGAWFTDSDTIGGNTFTTGTVQLDASPASAAFNVSNMAPGDVVYREITVANSGSLALRYAVTQSVGTGDTALAGVLDREVRTASTCDAAGFNAGTAIATPGKVSTSTVFGNPDTAQTGTVGTVGADRVLAAGASEKWCVKVSLPTSVDNTYANKAITGGVLTFTAAQTKNN